MNSALYLLEALGQLPDRDILEAHEPQKKRSLRRKVLILAAAAAVMLALTGCALAAWNWYTVYFAQKKQAPLSQGQISYIEDNAQDHGVAQSREDYTVELKTTLADDNMVYITLGITAPEDVDLGWALPPEEGDMTQWLSLEGARLLLDGERDPMGFSYQITEDGDGKKNTVNVVLSTDLEGARPETLEVRLEGLVRHGYDPDYEKSLLEGKYKGQTDYMLEGEESLGVHPETLLASGDWRFTVPLDEGAGESREILKEPIRARVLVTREGENYTTQDSLEDITITSIRLGPLGMTVAFEPPEPEGSFVEINPIQFRGAPWIQVGEEEDVYLLLRDGTKIHFFQPMGAKDSAFLEADSPIVLEDCVTLHLAGGTEVPIPAQ